MSIPSNFIYAGNPDKKWDWKFIPNTPEARQEAIKQGYNAFTPYSFDFEPTEENIKKYGRTPIKNGDLWIDFDSKKSPSEAIIAAREFINETTTLYKIDKRMIRYFLSGSKGCHICIPAQIYGDELGHNLLPAIHRKMVDMLISHQTLYVTPELHAPIYKNYIDNSLYCKGKGHLLREKNIKRADGRYKVEVPSEKFMNGDIMQLLSLTKENHIEQIDNIAPIQTELVELFDKATLYTQLFENPQKIFQSLITCKFMEYCLEKSKELEEPMWFLMLSVLSGLGIDTGMKLAVDFSKYYPNFDDKQTREKFLNAAQYYPTCKHIKEHFQCPASCKRHNPLYLNNSRICFDRSKNIYEVRDDGLYYGTKSDTFENMEKVCTYINPLGKICLTDNTGWGRYIEIKNSRGITSKEIIRMKDLNGTAEKAKDQLSDHGLEIENANAYKKVIDFLRTFNSNKIFTEVIQIGWYNDSFILPDQVFSHSLLENEEVVFNAGKENLITVSGTSEEWKKEIGEKCAGNDLLMFLCGYALSSVLLTPCNKEGGGIHLSGPSSSSKTTSAMVAGSMFGGNDTDSRFYP